MSLLDQAKQNLENLVQSKLVAMADNFFDLSFEEMDVIIEKGLVSAKNLTEILSSIDFNGLTSKVSYGAISLTPSSKIDGLWQVTTFNEKMKPLGDLGCVNKAEGIKQFIEEAGHLINVDDLMTQIANQATLATI